MKELLLPARFCRSIAEHAREAYPHEACGLVIGTEDRVTRVVRCPNVAPAAERRHRFEIDPRAVINVRRVLRASGEAVLGFYHSHPDAEARPSRTDLEYVRLWPETVWLITPVSAGTPDKPTGWWLCPGSEEPVQLRLEIYEPAPNAGCADS